MASVKIICLCGAVMESEGSETYCSFRSIDFLKAHEICRLKLQQFIHLKERCNCSWDYVTGESPHYFCGKCGEPMQR